MNTYLALLGRQPELSFAELEAVYHAPNLVMFGETWAQVTAADFSVDQLGGTIKAGRIVYETNLQAWPELSKKIIRDYAQKWQTLDHKQTLGISVYGMQVAPRSVQKCGIDLKNQLKKSGVSLRLIPNTEAALSSATSHHNKLGSAPNKTELFVVAAKGKVIIAESVGSQNISALGARDQARPYTDAFVGMLPPKLAIMMINLAQTKPGGRILDPFCGTGVVLQEASLLGYSVHGSDLSEKMIRYSRDNINWLQEKYHTHYDWYLHEGDAMTTSWQQPIDGIVAETYLGQPFSAPPKPEKLAEVKRNCNHIIGEFLRNLSHQIASGTPLCLAVPAWRDSRGYVTHLPVLEELETLGYTWQTFSHVNPKNLLYFREDQVVARQLLIIRRK